MAENKGPSVMMFDQVRGRIWAGISVVATPQSRTHNTLSNASSVSVYPHMSTSTEHFSETPGSRPYCALRLAVTLTSVFSYGLIFSARSLCVVSFALVVRHWEVKPTLLLCSRLVTTAVQGIQSICFGEGLENGGDFNLTHGDNVNTSDMYKHV